MAPTSTSAGIETVPWDTFVSEHFTWTQGEHVTLVGPTGGGKTFLALRILPLRRYVVVFALKRRDDTLKGLEGRKGEGYHIVENWPPPAPPTQMPRILLWPKVDRLDSLRATQARVFHAANDSIYRQGGWTVCADDLWYMCNQLRLGPDFETLWSMGRASKISVVGAVQRPRHIPLMAYSMATHLFFWQSTEKADLDRLGEIAAAGVDTDRIRHAVRQLPRHATLYVSTRTGSMVVTRAEKGR